MEERFDGRAGAFAYLLFVLLYFPCVATIAAIVRETGAAWATFVAAWTTGIAYIVATFFYQAATFERDPVSRPTSTCSRTPPAACSTCSSPGAGWSAWTPAAAAAVRSARPAPRSCIGGAQIIGGQKANRPCVESSAKPGRRRASHAAVLVPVLAPVLAPPGAAITLHVGAALRGALSQSRRPLSSWSYAMPRRRHALDSGSGRG
jgi:hypothetical protein